MVEPGFPSSPTVVEPRFPHDQCVVEQGIPPGFTAAEPELPHLVSTVDYGLLPSLVSGIMDENIHCLEQVMVYHLAADRQLRVLTRSTIGTQASRI